MIATLTLNPAIDITISLKQLRPGTVNRSQSLTHHAGGKGVNVSRVLRELGSGVLTMGVIGGRCGSMYLDLLDIHQFEMKHVKISGDTRINLVIEDLETGSWTKIDQRGPQVSSGEFQQVVTAVRETLPRASFLVLSGSLPPGLPQDTYYQLIEMAASCRVKTILDADGMSLKAGIRAHPTIAVPNVDEAARLLERDLAAHDVNAVLAAAIEIRDAFEIPIVAITCGPDGAVASTGEGDFTLKTPDIPVRCPIGSGDAFVAGVVAGLSAGKAVRDALVLGMATGTASAMLPGLDLCCLADVEKIKPQIEVEEIG